MIADRYEIHPFSKIRENMISALAELHIATMHTLLSDLGYSIVHRYYSIALHDPSNIGFCCIADDQKMVGWVVGSPDPSAINKRLLSDPIWFCGQLLHIIKNDPRAIGDLFYSLIPNSNNDLQQGQIELTYIGVSPAHLRQGIARALITRFITESSTNGYNQILLSVETDNPAAISLYSACGFTILNTFHEGRYHRHRMIFDLQGNKNDVEQI